jgi:hypothetical protein
MKQIFEVGVNVVSLVPEGPHPMAGFYSRTGFSQGTQDPLELTSVFFRQRGKEVWVCSADLCQFPDHDAKESGLRFLQDRLSCTRSSLFLNASHTHGSPTVSAHPVVLPPSLHEWFDPRYETASRSYCEFLWERVAQACEAAREKARPASILSALGTTRFPMNRRRIVNGHVDNAPCPDGDIENRIRLLGIQDESGKLKALGMVLACHPTSTGAQPNFTADFPGAWRRAMRQRLGNKVDFFFLQGSGGDARPACTANGDHWRPVDFESLERMGKELADETEAAIKNGWRAYPDCALAGARETFELPCLPLSPGPGWVNECPPGLDAYRKAYLEGIAADRAHGVEPPLSIHVDLSLVRLAPDLALIGADCEILCGLGRKMEAALPGVDAILCGLTNGGFGYVPDDEENQRGGYESESYIFEKWGGPFAPGIDNRLSEAVRSLWRSLPHAF